MCVIPIITMTGLLLPRQGTTTYPMGSHLSLGESHYTFSLTRAAPVTLFKWDENNATKQFIAYVSLP